MEQEQDALHDTFQPAAALEAALAQGLAPLKSSLGQLHVLLLRNLAALLPRSREHEAAQLYCAAVLRQGGQVDDALLWGRLGECAAKCHHLGLARFAMEQGIRIADAHVPLYEHAMEVSSTIRPANRFRYTRHICAG